MPKLLLTFLITLLFSAPAISQGLSSSELPQRPSGYTWVNPDEVRFAFLKPRNWYQYDYHQDGVYGYLITRNNAQKDGEYETALTVNIMRNTKEMTGLTAQEYASAFTQTFIRSMDGELIGKEDTEFGVFKGVVSRVEHNREDKEPVIIHRFIIGNTQTDTLYHLFFESPRSEFARHWESVSVIFKNLSIDQSF